MSECEGCGEEFIQCTHSKCGVREHNRMGYQTHNDCEQDGCGECLEGCSGAYDEYCEDCMNQIALDAADDRYTRRAEGGFAE